MAERLDLAAADRNFKIQIAQPQNIGVVEPWNDFPDLGQIDAIRPVAAEEKLFRQPLVKLGDIHRHHKLFAPGIHPRDFLIGGSVVDVVDIRDDDALVFDQVDAVAGALGSGVCAGRLCNASSFCSMVMIRAS